MSYPKELVKKVQDERKKGYSVKELAQKMGLSPDTVSRWVRRIPLSLAAKTILEHKMLLGQQKGRAVLLSYRQTQDKEINQIANKLVDGIKMNQDLAKLCSALLFWCEGSKEMSSLRFTNSDPVLVKLFLDLLRSSFKIDPNKLRVLMHLHQYHDEKKQKNFWSKVCQIPKEQFSKTYLKSNTSTNKHPGYEGCITIKYYDANIAKQLCAIYNSFTNRGVSQW